MLYLLFSVHPPHPVLKLHMSRKSLDNEFVLEENTMLSGIPCCNGRDSLDSAVHAKDCPYKGNVNDTVNPVVNRRTVVKPTSKKTREETISRKHDVLSTIVAPLSTPHGITVHGGKNKRKDILPNSNHAVAVGDTAQALYKIEESVRTSVQKCKNQLCKNFGNPSKKGYCNSCDARML
jgi:hypothetical protein